MSQHWKTMGPKYYASIPSGLNFRVHNRLIQHMQYKTKYKIHTNTNKSTHSEMAPVWQKQVHRTVKTAHLSVRIIVHNCHTQHTRSILVIFPLNLQTSITAQILEGRGIGGSKMWEPIASPVKKLLTVEPLERIPVPKIQQLTQREAVHKLW